MPEFTIHGTVPDGFQNEFPLGVENAEDLVRFWREAGIATRLSFQFVGSQRLPVIKVRGAMARECRPGNRILLCIETRDRVDGHCGIRATKLRLATD